MNSTVGQAVPDVPHAVSVSLPTWAANVGYEEGEAWVVSKMQTGYPRFFIHLIIQELQKEILDLYGKEGEKVMLFPSKKTASRCQAFFHDKRPELPPHSTRLIHLEPKHTKTSRNALSGVSGIFFPAEEFPTAKQFWQHTGEGIQSRRAEYCLAALRKGYLISNTTKNEAATPPNEIMKGPRRYRRDASQNNIAFSNGTTNGQDSSDDPAYDVFVEERYGRNLNLEYAMKAKLAVKRRIAGSLKENMELDQALSHSESSGQSGVDESSRDVSEDDVYLYPCGMNAIFHAHQLVLEQLRQAGKPLLKSICFGFPYIDTLKILQKWGPGALFYGNGVDEDLDDLESRLKGGERFAALFTEFPTNPLLRSPNLSRIRKLADEYDFVVVIDETVGNYMNINVLPHTDIVVSSLTKIFTGEANVMGGSLILNRHKSRYSQFKNILKQQYEDNYWAEDIVFMERNSRDFVSRIERINVNAQEMADTLKRSPFVKEVYYPSLVPSRKYYDACRTPDGGYGGLLSVTFHDREHAKLFFDNLEMAKGPSLGTNFSLSCPYVILAHYTELDWVQEFGIDPYLVRISVGLETTKALQDICDAALAPLAGSGSSK